MLIRNKISMGLSLLFLFILMITACAPAEEASNEPSAVENQVEYIYVDTDGWRSYFYEPESIEIWSDDEGNNIIDVFVRIEYTENLGTVAYERQLWHLNPENERYKISDAYAFESDGSPQET